MSQPRDQRPPIIVAVTGASGGCYAVRLVAALLEAGRRVELTATDEGLRMLAEECNLRFDAEGRNPHWNSLWPADSVAALLRWHPNEAINTGIASGSRPADGMVICPASLNTVGALASAMAANVVQRAAQVTLKERRRLVIVLRETPLATLHLEKLVDLSRSGAIILPAIPAFYHKPQSIADLVDYLVARILDQLHVPHNIAVPWRAANESDALP